MRQQDDLAQPVYVAEPFTNRSGEWASVSDGMNGFRRILDGAADNTDVDRLYFIGRLRSIRGLRRSGKRLSPERSSPER
ncbi:hypothetical protein FE784_14625 [Paenibacillus hemerocallicola]|uniref:Uncharacterized protein n=1 Tax=Paenibacillus hemerocallicola TaxID=1172614 RepID=A0A5C4T8P5_9BACL|nr:hypothetical protein [Paenibacillus hemerocallicola]TNJ65454.1 hypothetical protein FE784_14625 [Paenibacillus hemerocallicola]